MALPQHFMDELRRRVSLSDVIGKRVVLKKQGNRRTGLCPFHNEKTPSFHVRDDEGYYHCFGCGASGDAITFLREKEGMTFMDAVRTLAEQAGLDVPDTGPRDPEASAKRDKAFAILDDAARYYQSSLAEADNPAAGYLARRGVGAEEIKTFRLGYAPRQGFIQAMTAFGHDAEPMLEAGLTRRSDRDQSIYPYFRHRLIFPICDSRGKVIAFGGRALDDDQQPKYLNSAESPLFQKKAVLYGAHLARAGVKNGLPLLVTEGYMDVIAVHASGLAAAVAPLGTALTEDQISLLWRMDEQPILCFDGDRAGKAAALKALIRALPLLEPGKTLRLMLLPPGQDPDDVLRQHGRDGFSELLGKTISFLDALWGGMAEGVDLADPASRAGFWQDIRNHVRQIGHPQMRAALGDEVESRIAAMRAASRGRSGYAAMPSMHQVSRPKMVPESRARLILAILIEHPELIPEYYEQVGMLSFQNEKMEKIRQIVINAIIKTTNLDVASFRHHLNEFGFGEIRGVTLLDGMEKRLRFDPAEIPVEVARSRLSEVIKLEARSAQAIQSRHHRRHPGDTSTG
ncbi:MAG: DNA primase [Candidatus Puniceispirillales bacterium]